MPTSDCGLKQLVAWSSLWPEAAVEPIQDSLRHEQAPPLPDLTGLPELQVAAARKRAIAERPPTLVQHEFPRHD